MRRFLPLFFPLLIVTACSSTASLEQADPAERAKHVEIVAQIPLDAAPIKLVWQKNLDQRKPLSPPGFSLPASVLGKSGELIVAGSEDRYLRFYSASGAELNRIGLAAPSESGVLKLANGVIVVGDIAGNLYGIDLLQQVIKWQYKLSSALISKPQLVKNGFIIQTSNNQIYRFSDKGKKIWSFSALLGGLAMHLSPAPVIYHGRVYAAFSNGDVVALKAADGGFLWKRQTILINDAAVLSELKSPVAAPTVIPAAASGRDEDMLAVPLFQGQLLFLSLLDGSTLKARELSMKASPLLLGGKLLIADTHGAVSALDAASGETLWKKQLSNGELTGPVLAQGLLWFADDHGRVYRMDQEGHVAGLIELSGRIDRTPVVVGGGVIVRNDLGFLYMLR
ncbi:MAG: PQQ-binding-like beta-propeller repeat protein [Mariprofundus sp.]|nr:PQQ-binding-like beta-propeller repeat protein [Mariprofundus sp.]